MAISLLPSLSRSDPAFKSDVDTFFGTQLPNFTSELNTEIDRINQLGFGSYSATSTTTNTIGTGTKTFTVETGKGFVAGQIVIISDSSNVSNYMIGQINSYVSNTGVLTLVVSSTGGSGSISSWVVGITAMPSTSVVGDIVYSYTNPGNGWLPCDGSAYLQSAYPELYSKLGLLYHNSTQSGTPITGGPSGTKPPVAVKWLNNQFIAITATTTDTNQIWTSSGIDGTWVQRTSPEANSWRGVAYGSGYYVAVAQNGTNRVMRSSDAITWTAASAAAANQWQSVAFGNGVFVAVSQDGTNRVMRSTTAGASWTSVNVPAYSWGTVLWTGSKFVAFASNRMMESTDGVTWTDNALLISGSTIINAAENLITMFKGKFLSALNNSLFISSDGINWRNIPFAAQSDDSSFQFVVTNGSFVLLGKISQITNNPLTLISSNDLINWSVGTPSGNTFVAQRGAISPTGVIVLSGSNASPYNVYKLLGYNTSTQFVVPSLGINAYIRAEQ